MIMSIWS